MKNNSMIGLLSVIGIFALYIFFGVYFIMNFSRLFQPTLLITLMHFCGANCQRRLAELYRGIHGPAIQFVFGCAAFIASILTIGFAIGLFWEDSIRWFEPFMLYLFTIFVPVFDDVYMLVTRHERNWFAMFAVQIASVFGMVATAVFMTRFLTK